MPLKYTGSLKLRCGSRHFVYSNGFHPFGGDGITFFHRHAGIGVEHLSTTATAPREKGEEMVFADRTRPRWSIGLLQAVRHAALCIQHFGSPQPRPVCRSARSIFKPPASLHCLT